MRIARTCGRAGVALVIVSGSAFAQQALSGDEIARLVTGKTVEVTFHLQKDARFRSYFAPDGSAVSRRIGGSDTEGKWRIAEGNLHCTQWGKRNETCAQIVKDADDTYRRIEAGTVRATWHRVVDGKSLE